MVGAILGDIIGSRWEFNNIKTKKFELFAAECEYTDDTVMTCAVAKALMDCHGDYSDLSEKTIKAMHRIGRRHPNCGYGGMFFQWMFTDDPKPYNSFGNGSAMRVSPVAYFAKDLDEVKELSRKVTEVTHNHPEGVKGAEATAVAVYMALNGASKETIKAEMDNYYVPMGSVGWYRNIINGHGDETCMVSMPEALQCFYEGTSYEDVIRNCISIGGDSDTLGAIAGAIAGAFYGVPENIRSKLSWYLSDDLMDIVEEFENLR